MLSILIIRDDQTQMLFFFLGKSHKYIIFKKIFAISLNIIFITKYFFFEIKKNVLLLSFSALLPSNLFFF